MMVTTMLKYQAVSFGWDTIVNVGNPDAKMVVPMHPDAFSALLEKRNFTNGADRAVVADLYASTARAALGQTPYLKWSDRGWGDKEMEEMIQVFPVCENLLGFSLKYNEGITEAGAKALAAYLAAGGLPKLRRIGGKDTGLLKSAELKAACEARDPKILLDADCESYHGQGMHCHERGLRDAYATYYGE